MSLSDRDLLKLAAKAAGIVPAEFQGHGVGWYDASRGVICEWNPLTDDGDALRLSVKLGLFISNEQESSGSVTVAWGCDAGGEHLGAVEELAPEGGDDYAAARRAIVRAAAEIGRKMP